MKKLFFALFLTLLPVLAFGQSPTLTSIPSLTTLSGSVADGDYFPMHDLSTGGTNLRKVSALTLQAYFVDNTAFGSGWNGGAGRGQ
jgi:hypothetical protein